MLLPEIVAAGIYNSAVAQKNREITKNRKTTMFELEMALDEGGISYINDESTPIKKGLIICSKPNETRHTRLPFRCYFIHMIVNDGELLEILCSIPHYIEIGDLNSYFDIFASLCDYAKSGLKGDTIMAQSILLKLIYMLYEEAKRQPFAIKSGNGEDAVENVIHYIKSNLASELTLAKVAKFARFSPIHFHNRFKAATGKTLREFVEGERISRAANLLVETGLTLSEIAYECGFSSQAYFSYAFKKRMGVTPRQYAREFYSKYDK